MAKGQVRQEYIMLTMFFSIRNWIFAGIRRPDPDKFFKVVFPWEEDFWERGGPTFIGLCVVSLLLFSLLAYLVFFYVKKYQLRLRELKKKRRKHKKKKKRKRRSEDQDTEDTTTSRSSSGESDAIEMV